MSVSSVECSFYHAYYISVYANFIVVMMIKRMLIYHMYCDVSDISVVADALTMSSLSRLYNNAIDKIHRYPYLPNMIPR